MMHVQRLAVEFFAMLEKLDEKIAAKVAAGGCQYCDGPLHQGNYQRKPRGGTIGAAGEEFTRRHSLCCGRRGCRKRALPPSLRFLGRRVYLEVVVVLASVMVQVMATARAAEEASGVPLRTLRRWGSWWREVFPKLPTWAELRARFVPPPPDEAQLPWSLLARLGGQGHRPDHKDDGGADASSLLLCGRYLAPATSDSVMEGSGFVTAAFAQMGVA
jgi:hypothetical protein